MQVAPTIAPDLQAPAPTAAANSTPPSTKGSFANHLQNAKTQHATQAASTTEANGAPAKTVAKGNKGRLTNGQSTATADGQENTAAAGAAAATAQPQTNAATGSGTGTAKVASAGTIDSIPASASTLKMLGLQPQTATIPDLPIGQTPAGTGLQATAQPTGAMGQNARLTAAQSAPTGMPTAQSMAAASQTATGQTATGQIAPPNMEAGPTAEQFTIPGQTVVPNPAMDQTMAPATGVQQAQPLPGAADRTSPVQAPSMTAAAVAANDGGAMAPSGISAGVAAALGLSPQAASQAASAPAMPDPQSPAQAMAAQPQVAAAQPNTKVQDKAAQEMPVPIAGTEEGIASATQDGNRLNANDQYIHAHLPNKNTGSASPDQDGHPASDAALAGKQQESAHVGANGSTAATSTEQFVLQRQQATMGQDSPSALPLHHQTTPQSTTSTSSSTSSASSFLLPSGTSVPDSTVVNQMLDHLNLHKGLETSTVNLKLSPQELGELRMEIKVAQDTVKAHIIAQNPQAQEMIDRHLPRLREALEQQGLHLQQIEVTVGSYDHSGSDQFQQQTAWQHQGQTSHRSRGEHADFALPTTEAGTTESTAIDSNALSVLA